MAALDLSTTTIQMPYSVFAQLLSERDAAVKDADTSRQQATDLSIKVTALETLLSVLDAQVAVLNTTAAPTPVVAA